MEEEEEEKKLNRGKNKTKIPKIIKNVSKKKIRVNKEQVEGMEKQNMINDKKN